MKEAKRTQKTASNFQFSIKCKLCSDSNCPVRNKEGRRNEVTINGTTFVTMCPKDEKGKEEMYTY